jgi:hypothetical protein
VSKERKGERTGRAVSGGRNWLKQVWICCSGSNKEIRRRRLAWWQGRGAMCGNEQGDSPSETSLVGRGVERCAAMSSGDKIYLARWDTGNLVSVGL